MATEDNAILVSGVAQGAAAGAAFGPVGAAVGGIIGGIAGIFGSKANKAKRRARKEQRRMTEREQAVQRRDLIRNFRLARAQALAAGSSETGGLESSGVQGAAASIASQGVFNLNFFDAQVASQRRINDLLKTAGKYEGYLSVFESVAQAGSAFAELIPVGEGLAKTASKRTMKKVNSGLYDSPPRGTPVPGVS
jgi:hypothetical protein